MKQLLPLRRKKGEGIYGREERWHTALLLLLLFKKTNTRTRLLAVVPEATTTRDSES